MKEEIKYRMLIIDDDRTVCSSLQLLFNRKGYKTESIHHPGIVLEKIQQFLPHVVLLDMNFTIDTSGKQGLKLLQQIRIHFPEIHVILMTGWATVELAVQGMKLGAKDFVAKPWTNKQITDTVHSIITLYGEDVPFERIEDFSDTHQMIGEDPAFMEVVKMAEKVAPTEASVLILGESGTGKELLAEAIHQRSKRSEHEFVKVNLGGISSSLFESEMFGHKKGAFTDAISDREGRFSKAHKGTIFLDEIGELHLDSQVKLLRVLQEKSFEILGSSQTVKSDFRIISATNKDLGGMVMDGDFREDLYYRINLITLILPSLTERNSDIPLMVRHFTKQISTLYQREIPYISDETMRWLSNQPYPGNIRELKNQVERVILLNFDQKEITVKHFKNLKNLNTRQSFKIPEVGTLTLDQMEEHMIRQALKFHSNNISKSASSLGITRSSLYRRIEKYNIPYEPSI